MGDVRIGIVGLAFGQCHVGTIAKIDGVEVAAVADNRPVGGTQSVADYAAAHGAAGYDDGVAMIREADIDAVDLVVAPKYRLPLLSAAAERKLPVLMEKPMATSVAQAEAFAAVAAEAGIPLMIEYPMRFYPAVRRLRGLLHDGPLGRPLNVEGNLQTFWNPPAGHWTWDDDNAGGLINECSCHLIDTLCFLCGRPVGVFAAGGNVQGNGPHPDTAAITIDFDGGCTALANAGGLGAAAFGTPMVVRVFAEYGEARLSGGDWTYHRVAHARRGWEETVREEVLDAPPRQELLRFAMMEFAEAVRAGIEPPCGAADGLRVQRVVAAAVESMRSRRYVVLA